MVLKMEETAVAGAKEGLDSNFSQEPRGSAGDGHLGKGTE